MLTLNENTYKATLTNNSVVLVDFWAPWCGPCKTVIPLVEAISEEYKGSAVFGKVNIDENSDIAIELGIRSIPTLVLFKNGTPVDRLNGQSINAGAIKEMLNSYIE
jgi:thioredoxin 1